MCLSTVYRGSKEDDNILCKFVSNIRVNGDEITLTDVMGFDTVVQGKLQSADLTAGVVIIAQ